MTIADWTGMAAIALVITTAAGNIYASKRYVVKDELADARAQLLELRTRLSEMEREVIRLKSDLHASIADRDSAIRREVIAQQENVELLREQRILRTLIEKLQLGK